MLTWNVDPVLFHGPYPLRIYGVLFAFAVVGGFLLFRWQLMRAGEREEEAGWFLAYALGAIIAGARLVHCFVYDLPRTLADPLSVVRPWEGGLSSHGAILGLAIATLIFARRHRIAVADLCDWQALGAALAVVLVRIANFFNSEIVGRPTGGHWGVRFLRWDGPNAPPRHPVQLYEAALGLVLFVVLLVLVKRTRRSRDGLLVALCAAVYFGCRVVLELFKEPEGLPSTSSWTWGQVLSLAPALLGAAWLLLLWRRARRSRRARS
jgi:phosphatidylglycerol---prolipoprotein diacylglyceryl transferase